MLVLCSVDPVWAKGFDADSTQESCISHPPTLPPKTGTREEQPDPHYRTVGSSVFIEKSGSKVRNVKVARIKMKPFVPT